MAGRTAYECVKAEKEGRSSLGEVNKGRGLGEGGRNKGKDFGRNSLD